MTDLNSVLKSIDITLLTKVDLVKAMVFPVVMSGCESWTIKKAECQKIDAWTARRSNQSILEEINPEYSLEGLMLKLQLPWPSYVKSWLIGKDPDTDRDWWQEKGATGWNGWMVSLTQWTRVWANSGRCWRTGNLSAFQSMRLQRVGHDWAAEQQKISYFKIMAVIPYNVQCILGVLLLLNLDEDFTS